MKIIPFTANLLDQFLQQLKISPMPTFRYFDKRDQSHIKNHIVTLFGILDDDTLVSYGHLDQSDGKIWLGICVLSRFQHMGYGKLMMTALMGEAEKRNLDEIYLSVDHGNFVAKQLYINYGFLLIESKVKFDVMVYRLNKPPLVTPLESNVILLPVSVGEAVDKLSILEIKTEKISDSRLVDVKKEYLLLADRLRSTINNHQFYYKILLQINRYIWDMQDKFRESISESEKNKLCHDIIVENDRRFRIKKKLNLLSQSYLIEQKGYQSKTALFMGHQGLGDLICCNGLVRYLSSCYEKVLVVVDSKKNTDNIKLFFGDDESIEFLNISEYRNSSRVPVNVDKYLSGQYSKFGSRGYIFPNLPLEFYDDVEIDRKYFREYFYFPKNPKSLELFKLLPDKQSYVFIHSQSSGGIGFDGWAITKQLKLDNLLLINPNQNMYNPGDPFYNLANQFIDHFLLDYVDLMINSEALVLVDSSFFCLAIHLPILTDQCYIIARRRRNYDHLFVNLEPDRRKFIRLDQ